MQIVAGTKLGAYRIVRKLGEGGMGSVFEAVHERLQKRVAVKTLHDAVARDADAVARFVREGRAASRIRHPHVVDVTDVGVEEGTPFLVMELLEGESLASLLARSGPLPGWMIADVTLAVADALAAAHAAGIVHRDLKPENVFLSRSPSQSQQGEVHPIVLDFGISWIADEVRLTKTAHFMGTPYYMSPEQAQSARSVDARSDQFSLGLVLFELTTGRRALAGSSVLEIVHKVSSEGAPRLSQLRADLPPAFTAVVDRMTARRPEDRFPSMRDVGSALLPFASPRGAALWSAAFSGPALSGAALSGAAPSGAALSGSQRAAETPRSVPPAFTASARPPAFSTPGLATDPTVSARTADRTRPAERDGLEPPGRGAARRSSAPERRSHGVLLTVLAVSAVLGAVGVAFVVGLSIARAPDAAAAAPLPGPGAVPPAATPTPSADPAIAIASPAASTIAVRLRAIPATAEILLDGSVVANGSYAGTLARDGIPHVLEVRAPGFVPHTIQFLDVAPIAQIELEPIPRHHRGPVVPRRSEMTEAGLVEAPAGTLERVVAPAAPAVADVAVAADPSGSAAAAGVGPAGVAGPGAVAAREPDPAPTQPAPTQPVPTRPAATDPAGPEPEAREPAPAPHREEGWASDTTELIPFE